MVGKGNRLELEVARRRIRRVEEAGKTFDSVAFRQTDGCSLGRRMTEN